MLYPCASSSRTQASVYRDASSGQCRAPLVAPPRPRAYRNWSDRRRATSQLRWPARSLGSTQRRLYDQAMERRNSRDIGPPSEMIEGHDRCGDKSAAQSGLFNQNGQTEVEMAIVLAKYNLMTTPIVDPKEIDPVGRKVIAQPGRCLKTKPRDQNVP